MSGGWPYTTARWRALRLAHLQLFPMCSACRSAPANTVDHVEPVSQGGNPFPGHDGLESYCTHCHSAKTARGPEAGAVRTTRPRQPRKGCAPDGTPLDLSHPWAATRPNAKDTDA